MTSLGPGATKAALDAMTDQSLAAMRDQRHHADPVLAERAAEVAATLAEQFPGERATAGRVVMAVTQVIESLIDKFDDDLLKVTSDMFALAAEQLVREGGD